MKKRWAVVPHYYRYDFVRGRMRERPLTVRVVRWRWQAAAWAWLLNNGPRFGMFSPFVVADYAVVYVE